MIDRLIEELAEKSEGGANSLSPESKIAIRSVVNSTTIVGSSAAQYVSIGDSDDNNAAEDYKWFWRENVSKLWGEDITQVDFNVVALVGEMIRRYIPMCRHFEEKCKRERIAFDWIDVKNWMSDHMNDERLSVLQENKEIEDGLNAEIKPNCTDRCRNPNCRVRNVFYIAAQTRCSDEPTTLFYRCLTCGTRWRD